MVITLILITVLSRVNSDSWQDTFLGLTIFGIVLINAFSAVFQGKKLKSSSSGIEKYS